MVKDSGLKLISVSLLNLINFGTVLQNYATNQYLNLIGYDSYILNYRFRYDNIKHNFKTFIINIIVDALCIIREIKFSCFLRNNTKMTRRYFTHKQIEDNPPFADIFLVGSDQVWNPDYGNNIHRLEWVQDSGTVKIAYSSSIGKDKLDSDKLNELSKALKSFVAISVREKSGRQILQSAGLKNIQQVVDPVFLLEKEEYIKFIKPNKIGKYAFVLSYEKLIVVEKALQQIKSSGLKVIEAGYSRKKYGSVADSFYRNIGIEDFLTLIYNAEVVVTTSFRALAFCLIFNKDFYVVKNEIATSRLTEMLTMVGLQDRMIESVENVNKLNLDLKIDWDKVNYRLNNAVRESKKWLQEALHKCERELQNEQLS